MVDVDAAAVVARARRRTWLTGGVLFVASALLSLGMSGVQDLLPGMAFGVTELLFYGGAVIMAIGLSRAGSITARRPLGTGAIIALAVWQLVVTPMVWGILNGSNDTRNAAMSSDFSVFTVVATTMKVVTLILAVVAVMQVGRSGVVPKPWNWAPLWALLAVAASQMLPSLLSITMPKLDQPQLYVLFSLGGLLQASAIAFLGVLAIVLALRPVPGSTVVYGSGV